MKTFCRRELYRHKRGEDRPPGAPLMAYVCEECDKVLGSMCALHTHKKMHKVTKPVINVFMNVTLEWVKTSRLKLTKFVHV